MTGHDRRVRVEQRGCRSSRGGSQDGFGEDAAKEREMIVALFPLHTLASISSSLLSFFFFFPQYDLSSIHMIEQLLDLSLLKVEESSSVLLGRCRSLLERRRTGLGLLAAWSLFMQARAAVRKTLWMLFSDVKAEHSR